MEDHTLSLLKLFGDRYIHCDDDQALADVRYNREDMVEAFNAILDYAEMKKLSAENTG